MLTFILFSQFRKCPTRLALFSLYGPIGDNDHLLRAQKWAYQRSGLYK